MSSSGTPATGMPITDRQLRLILAITCAVCVIGAVSEAQIVPAAQTPSVTRTQNVNFTQTIEDENPCNGRPLTGEGKNHTQITDKSSGTTTDTTVRTHINGQAFAVDEPTQRYQYQSWGSVNFRSSEPDFTFTVVTRKHMIHEGQRRPDLDFSFFVWTEQTFGTAPPTFNPIRYECKTRKQTD